VRRGDNRQLPDVGQCRLPTTTEHVVSQSFGDEPGSGVPSPKREATDDAGASPASTRLTVERQHEWIAYS
jgi:hypothetical protein